jgi:hypothetical protein
MKAGELAAVVTSPPYADSVKGQHGETETAAETTAKRNTPGGSLGKSQRHGGYGSKGNIGNLKEGGLQAVVTSPPWENQEPSHAQGTDFERKHRELHPGKLAANRPGLFSHEYGSSVGQLGNTAGDTYWQAVAAVYQQVHQALKPGGVFVLVVKAYVKAGQRVPLPDQTAELLERLGFRPLERIRAWLVEETTHAGLFGAVREKKERKSFFRRLAESKGSPPIDWEEVLVFQKEQNHVTDNGAGMAGVGSEQDVDRGGDGLRVAVDSSMQSATEDAKDRRGQASDHVPTTSGVRDCRQEDQASGDCRGKTDQLPDNCRLAGRGSQHGHTCEGQREA